MRELQVFTNLEFGEIRTLLIDEQPWFVGKDVASALGYADPSGAVRKHCKHIRKEMLQAHGQNGHVFKTQTSLINEGDIYRLIVRSKLPSAQKFEEWVMDEILPEIRKTGGYIDEGATTEQLEQLQQKINKLLNYKIKGDTINDVCSATGLRRKDIKRYLFDNDWIVEYNGKITNYDCRYIFIERHKDVHFTTKGLDRILRDLQPLKPVRPLINKDLYRK